MITFEDHVKIHTTPEQLFSWLENMPQEYRRWHPDHVACKVIHGSMLEVGSQMECQEYLHGKLHTMRFRITNVIPNMRVDYVVIGMGAGAFEVQSIGEGVSFIAELEIGSELPIIGKLFDWIFSIFFGERIAAMHQHMAEEGQILKSILEQDLLIG